MYGYLFIFLLLKTGTNSLYSIDKKLPSLKTATNTSLVKVQLEFLDQKLLLYWFKMRNLINELKTSTRFLSSKTRKKNGVDVLKININNVRSLDSSWAPRQLLKSLEHTRRRKKHRLKVKKQRSLRVTIAQL